MIDRRGRGGWEEKGVQDNTRISGFASGLVLRKEEQVGGTDHDMWTWTCSVWDSCDPEAAGSWGQKPRTQAKIEIEPTNTSKASGSRYNHTNVWDLPREGVWGVSEQLRPRQQREEKKSESNLQEREEFQEEISKLGVRSQNQASSHKETESLKRCSRSRQMQIKVKARYHLISITLTKTENSHDMYCLLPLGLSGKVHSQTLLVER